MSSSHRPVGQHTRPVKCGKRRTNSQRVGPELCPPWSQQCAWVSEPESVNHYLSNYMYKCLPKRFGPFIAFDISGLKKARTDLCLWMRVPLMWDLPGGSPRSPGPEGSDGPGPLSCSLTPEQSRRDARRSLDTQRRSSFTWTMSTL